MSKRSYVYFNLHRRTWSERVGGLVVDHPKQIFLLDARFLVGKAGQAKVRASGRKNVHAGVSGIKQMWNDEWDNESVKPRYSIVNSQIQTNLSAFQQLVDSGEAYQVTYNPYENDEFVLVETGEPIDEAEIVWMFIGENKCPQVWAYNISWSVK